MASIGDEYNPGNGEFTTPPPPAPPPFPVIRTIVRENWYNRWTDDDLGTLIIEAQTNVGLAGWLDWIKSQSAIDLDSARVIDKLQAGVTGGFITQASMDALLADVTENEI